MNNIYHILKYLLKKKLFRDNLPNLKLLFLGVLIVCQNSAQASPYSVEFNSVRDSLNKVQDISDLNRTSLRFIDKDEIKVAIPKITTQFAGLYSAVDQKNNFIFYSLDPKLQKEVEDIVTKNSSEHVAAVVMDAKSGKIRAIAGKSRRLAHPEFHNMYPAASLFKIVTAAAAVETSNINDSTVVRFRGGDYILNQYNYMPSTRSDRRAMTVAEAMSKSVNPVFGRLAMKLPQGNQTLQRFAKNFGFNLPLETAFPLNYSNANIPNNSYELSRTGAGFGRVTLSPVHAATIMSGLLNNGIFPKPYLVDKVINPNGKIVFRAHAEDVNNFRIKSTTASKVLKMMEKTVSIGTAKNAFYNVVRSYGNNQKIFSKTGTLTGSNPPGLTTWFISNLDENTAMAVVSVGPYTRASKAPYIGSKIFVAYKKYLSEQKTQIALNN